MSDANDCRWSGEMSLPTPVAGERLARWCRQIIAESWPADVAHWIRKLTYIAGRI